MTDNSKLDRVAFVGEAIQQRTNELAKLLRELRAEADQRLIECAQLWITVQPLSSPLAVDYNEARKAVYAASKAAIEIADAADTIERVLKDSARIASIARGVPPIARLAERAAEVAFTAASRQSLRSTEGTEIESL